MVDAYRIGVRGCQHLGYAARGMRYNGRTHWNQRVVDGHIAHELAMRDMLAAGVSGIVDGGDLTHWNKPVPRDTDAVQRVDDLRVAAGAWLIGNSGNHCASGGTDISAMSIVHRPALHAAAVYPDPTRGPGDGTGPYPGLYEVHQPTAGLALHLVSHYGLERSLADHGITIDPAPIPGHVNLLFCHGVFIGDDRLYNCVNPHGEERAIPTEWTSRGWDAVLLSHYHTLGPVPGLAVEQHGQVWYTGSSLTRGFSDELGPRGWLLVTIHDVGRVTVTPRHIWQRPQVDLPPIDAAGLTVTEIDDRIAAALARTPLADAEAAALTGDAGSIVRQRVVRTTAAQRQGLAALRARHAKLTEDAAWWGIDDGGARAVSGPSLSTEDRPLTRRITDFRAELCARLPALLDAGQVPAPIRGPVADLAEHWAADISVPTDGAEADGAGGTSPADAAPAEEPTR